VSNATLVQGEKLGQRRVRGNWSTSPLYEGKILLGVLRQEGLAGKGLVGAFDRWAPRITGATRSEMNRVYEGQTGRELSDYILVQQADKAVRYRQLPPEAESFRLALAKSRAQAVERGAASTNVEHAITKERDTLFISRRNAVTLRMARLLAMSPDEPDPWLSGALLSTNEVADLTGFAPKTIRRWASRKLLNFIRVGNQYRFRAAAVKLFLSQREIRLKSNFSVSSPPFAGLIRDVGPCSHDSLLTKPRG